MTEKIVGLTGANAATGGGAINSTYMPVQAPKAMMRTMSRLSYLEEWFELWTDHKQELGISAITLFLGIWMLDKFAFGAMVFLASATYWFVCSMYHSRFMNQFSDFRVIVKVD